MCVFFIGVFLLVCFVSPTCKSGTKEHLHAFSRCVPYKIITAQ